VQQRRLPAARWAEDQPALALRNRPIVGLQIFEGWKEVGANKWKGSVYDPEDGTSYDIDITLAGNDLTLKGCIAFLCDSDTWTRYRGQ